MFLRIIPFLAIALWLCPFTTTAQILDDTTRQLYGPTTTQFLLERDVLENRDRTFSIDTTLNTFHNYMFMNRYGFQYQSLGYLGTPLFPVFYPMSTQIGTYLGLNAYDPYAFGPDDIRYFDTQSPFTSVSFAQGGGQQMLDVEFSRNVVSNWNLGLIYKRITVDNPFLPLTGGRNQDRVTDHHSVAIFTRYHNKDSTYQLLAHFSHLNHHVDDKGGIRAGADVPQDSLFDYENAISVLRAATSRDFRNNHHLYHQYAFARGFQLYHILDVTKQDYNYHDPLIAPEVTVNGANVSSRDFYPNVYFRQDTSFQKQVHRLVENKVGIKGSFAGMDYRLYARRRDFSLRYEPAYLRKITRNENFIGAWINYNINDSARINAEAEYLLFRDYRIGGTYQNRFWRIGAYSLSQSPTLIQEQAQNNHFIWNNDFRQVATLYGFAHLYLKVGQFEFSPFANVRNIKNFIFYNQDAVPEQTAVPVQILSTGFDLNFNIKNFHTITNVTLSRTAGNASVVRIPEIFVNSRLFYQNYLFKRVLLAQAGVDLHYKSAYQPNAYMPVLQQFYLQDNFTVGPYLVADAYVNVRISRVRLFVKMIHVNQDLPDPGYFISPYFFGMPRTFVFGLNWMLFD